MRVVGQQQQPTRVLIEPSDRDHPLTHALNQIVNRGASFRILVTGDVAFGLVKQKVDFPAGADRFAVEHNLIALQVHPMIRRLNQFAIHPDAPRADPLARIGARTKPGLREHTFQGLKFFH